MVRPPLVSVIIPAYNAEKFIARTLRSVQQQTFSNLDIIVVNDGSTDSTERILEEISLKDHRIRIITKENGGVAAARNDGLSASKGSYVAFVDADDLWHPCKIERQTNQISANNDREAFQAVYSLYRIIDEDDKVIGNGPYWAIKGSSLAQHIVMHPVGNGSSLLVSRTAAIAVGGFDPAYAKVGAGGCEDLDFELKIAARFRIGAISQYLVGYRLHQENMSSDPMRMARAMDLTVRRHLACNPDFSRDCVRWALSRLAVYQLFCYLKARNLAAALKAGGNLVLDDPAFALQEIPWRMALRILRARAQHRGSVPFYELCPSQVQRKWHRPLIRRRLRALEREDIARLH